MSDVVLRSVGVNIVPSFVSSLKDHSKQHDKACTAIVG